MIWKPTHLTLKAGCDTMLAWFTAKIHKKHKKTQYLYNTQIAHTVCIIIGHDDQFILKRIARVWRYNLSVCVNLKVGWMCKLTQTSLFDFSDSTRSNYWAQWPLVARFFKIFTRNLNVILILIVMIITFLLLYSIVIVIIIIIIVIIIIIIIIMVVNSNSIIMFMRSRSI